MDQKFTLVIPTYNESGIINESLTMVTDIFKAKCPEPWRIVVADNASTDGTADIVEKFGDPHVSVIRLTEKGRGRALRTAFAASEGIVAFTDADLPIDPNNVIDALKLVKSGDYDVVVGTRFAKGADAKDRPLLRRGSSLIFHVLAVVITRLKSSDSQCPLRVMNEKAKKVMLATVDPTWWCELEFLLMAERLNIRMKEYPVTWNDQRFERRKSTVKVIQDGWKAVKAMFKMNRYLPPIIENLRKTL
jgi:glycosyltransferase involved in cell wall biosynthesis